MDILEDLPSVENGNKSKVPEFESDKPASSSSKVLDYGIKKIKQVVSIDGGKPCKYVKMYEKIVDDISNLYFRQL